MANNQKKYSFDKPNYKFEDSPLDDRLRVLEQKFTRLTVWVSILTFLLVAVIGAVIVQIVLNAKTPSEDNSTEAALSRHTQRQSLASSPAASTHRDTAMDTCCTDLQKKVDQLHQEVMAEIEQIYPKVNPFQPPVMPNSDVAPNPAEHEKKMPTPEISPETFVGKEIEYDYPENIVDSFSGDDSIFIDERYYDYYKRDNEEVLGSGVGKGISDDEDLVMVEGSGCRPFSRPVCSDGCVTNIMKMGCPVPVCCKGVPQANTNTQSSGHHHHHH